MPTTRNTTKYALLMLAATSLLTACGDSGQASTSGCRTNVDGCTASAFSCAQAQLCYPSAAECQASGECGAVGNGGGGPGVGAPGGGAPGGGAPGGGAPGGANPSRCRTNVDGCDPSAHSCDAAQFCYASAADCDASGECG